MNSNKNILYIEDNINDVELTIEALNFNKLRIPIDVVYDGAEAIDYLFYSGKYTGRVKRKPSLILLDMKLPKLNGLEVLRKIRESDEYKLVPVVILSSSQIHDDIINSYNLGANGYVIKPVNFEEFIEVIKSIIDFWIVYNTIPY